MPSFAGNPRVSSASVSCYVLNACNLGKLLLAGKKLVSSRLCNVLPLTSTARSRLIHWTLPAFIFPQLAMPGITHKNPNPEAYLFSGLFEEDTSAPYAGEKLPRRTGNISMTGGYKRDQSSPFLGITAYSLDSVASKSVTAGTDIKDK
ncbi:predicted protein [Histoplasma capsulatum G186AR]|uniref:Uncharacterized protein n=1 Tax=Ajellomyces capsulatus (strain G186AR / H82 / ATCC MYA-2454 / RMSCC 2432) TaxID=447093 RepID=C0NCV1_AJECG|nr:uncharacterized protein HCBG_00947 [Histoplasma capsulatum G186AR]EEH11492.1 predicted protein [Histoplasma capsulatum G186AR]